MHGCGQAHVGCPQTIKTMAHVPNPPLVRTWWPCSDFHVKTVSYLKHHDS